MDKAYAPHEIERRIYEQWESRGWFAPSGRGSPFCIMIPPPNVTGTLHMGHAFQHTLMDALTRYHRMRGDDALWQPGTDHAGIATQMVVERQLEAQGRKRSELRARPSSSAFGNGRRNRAARSPRRCAAWGTPSTGRAIASRWIPACRKRCWKCSCACTTRASSIAASGWSTGIRCCSPRSPTSRCRARRKRVTFGICATLSRTDRDTSSWPRRGLRRCWATPPLP